MNNFMVINNFDEMDKLHRRHKLSKCTQNEIDNLKNTVFIGEIEFSTTFQAQIASNFYKTYMKFYPILKKEIVSVLRTLFRKLTSHYVCMFCC